MARSGFDTAGRFILSDATPPGGTCRTVKRVSGRGRIAAMVYLLIWTDNIGAVAVQAYDTEELRNEARDRRLDPRRMCGYTAFNLMPVSDSHARLVEEF